MHALGYGNPTSGSPFGRRDHTLRRVASMVAIALATGCGGGAGGSDTFSGPETLKVTALSPASVTAKMGDLVSVSLRVTALDGGPPPFGTKVAFAPSDGGTVSVTPYALPGTDAYVTWRLGAAVKSQTLTATVDGARPFVFQANVTGSAWTVVTSGTLRYTTRLADEGSISAGGGDPWSATLFGSPPRLVISCNAGIVGIAIAHPKMAADGTWTAYSFNGSDVYTTETWSQLAPRGDSLFHPGPTTATGALAKQIAASSVVRLLYRQYVASGNYSMEIAPTFGTSGLSQVMPQLMANCPAGR